MVKTGESSGLTRLAWRRGGAERALGRLERSDPEALAVLSLVAGHRGVEVLDLLRNSRCRAHIAAARQLAMYLVNVKLGRTMTEIGCLFGRDRTTVSHACRVVEDRREGAFEREVEQLELAIDALADPQAATVEVSRAVAC
jgi:chromosomal replication initiation ATPase DnaA